MKIKSIGLCEGRQEMPVSEFVYPNTIEDPSDYQAMLDTACDFIRGCMDEGFDTFELYITGLTAACAAFIKACVFFEVSLTLMHFDAKTGEYKPQHMFTYLDGALIMRM